MSSKNYWVVGNHAVRTLLKLSPERVLKVLSVGRFNNDQEDIALLLHNLGLKLEVLDKQRLAGVVESDQHQGIAVQVRAKPEFGDRELVQRIDAGSPSTPWLFLVLDQVQDPRNLGACLRTADAAGAHGLIVPKDNSAPLSPIVHKVASGAAETVDIFRVSNLSRSLDNMKQKGIWLLGTSDKATNSLYEQDMRGPIALVMGAEGKGMRRLTEQACDVLMRLPMAGDCVSSLNVSVATGVCLYEALRQRSL
ncbi:MAG: 23S rRNA (guanosine(2251)-2'-O)-methyltransferase RlmB [Arenicella sp.]|nr:23S rRNA (guanosine(2251)-2'-O)-methyltransferase RlmB [Arenicella sp.]